METPVPVWGRVIERGPLVDVGGGLLIVEWLDVECHAILETGPNASKPGYVLRIRAGHVADTDRYDVLNLDVATPPDGVRITSEGLRSIPVASIRRQLAERAVVGYISDEGIVESLPDRWKPPYRRDDDDYRLIGILHRSFQMGHDSATAILAGLFDISAATAYRWTLEVKERGVMAKRWTADMDPLMWHNPETGTLEPMPATEDLVLGADGLLLVRLGVSE